MSRVFTASVRRIPIHRRPLVLAMVMPLAATCLMAPANAGAMRSGVVGEQVLRIENTAALQERQRRLCDLLAGERLLDDPPAGIARRGEPDDRSPAEIAAVASAEATRFAAPDARASFHRFVSGIRSDHFPPASRPRGPPSGGYMR